MSPGRDLTADPELDDHAEGAARSSENSEKSNDLIRTLRHAWPRATRHDQILPEQKNRHVAIYMIYVNRLWTAAARNMESCCRTKCNRFLFRLATSLTASRVQLTTRTTSLKIQNKRTQIQNPGIILLIR